MIQMAKNEDFGHFLEFRPSDWLDIAYLDSTKQLDNNVSHARSFKNQKNAFLNDPKMDFSHFHEFGESDRLDIACLDSMKWS